MLEPSGPEARDDPFLAPDPVAAGVRGARPIVSPLGTGDLTWDAFCDENPDLVPWCRARWLAALAPLPAPPAGLTESVHGLHQLAQHVLAPWRYQAHRRIGLRWTLGGFGTPFVHVDRQSRVTDGLLVRQSGDVAEGMTPSTLGEAAAWLGGPLGAPPESFTPASPADPEEPLTVRPDAAAWVGEWFGFATRVLEEVRVGEPDYGRRRVQLWPEHFDVSVELGAGPAGGTFGASPGDADHDGPYLYVTEWEKGRLAASEWRDPAFPGVSLPVADLLAAREQTDAAVAFFEHHRMLLERGPG
ncbi:hypothetical protein K6U06_06705 [Acidiferrimicrobium sp. IK]|uniref:hypothetical protein n=1 Tax=Acidiferrimicrobium sp. IK TaxID=2871700 RepID=UPI0021CAFAD1|nr:hypothetical protein [Acidiferrimicrobium sp. IK]MCU4184044.1 hypothetical protein [Acidiferrimicrobium sp. IK]